MGSMCLVYEHLGIDCKLYTGSPLYVKIITNVGRGERGLQCMLVKF